MVSFATVARTLILLVNSGEQTGCWHCWRNLSPAAIAFPTALGRGGTPIRREQRGDLHLLAADGRRTRQPVRARHSQTAKYDNDRQEVVVVSESLLRLTIVSEEGLNFEDHVRMPRVDRWRGVIFCTMRGAIRVAELQVQGWCDSHRLQRQSGLFGA